MQAAIRLRQQRTISETQPNPARVALRLLYVDAPGTIMGAPEDWPRWAVLLPHVLAVLEHIETAEGDDKSTSRTVSWLLNQAGAFHGREARPLLERALAIDEAVYGPDHPSTQAIRANRDGLVDE